jgi:hypothetical protein
VPGERNATELPAPGSLRPGFGRHEAMAFDRAGRLWLVADRGPDEPSTVTVLVPR